MGFGSEGAPPDNVTLELASGLLQIKDLGVDTAKIAANAVTLAKFLRGGNAGEVLTSNGTGADATYQAAAGLATVLETLTYTAGGTQTTGALAAHTLYHVRGYFEGSVAGGNSVRLRINGDTGSNYNYHHILNTTVVASVSQSSIHLCDAHLNQRSEFDLWITGVTAAVASIGRLGGHGGCQQGIGTGISGVSVGWIGGNAVQITDFTVFPSSGTITGKAQFLGVTI